MSKQIEIITAGGTITTGLTWAKWESPESAIAALQNQIGTTILHWYFA